MSLASLNTSLCAGALLCSALLCSAMAPAQQANTASEPAASVISLAPNPASQSATAQHESGELTYANVPANFHIFASARAGEDAGVEQLTLNFSASTRLTSIQSSGKDFRIEQGGTCIEGDSYEKGGSCALLVSFSPKGAGSRLGKITIAHSASPHPTSIGLTGYGYAPVISFTPAVITTVPGTYPSSAGLLSGALNLTVDGSDTLYAADTGNNAIRSMNSSGSWTTLASGYTTPWSVAVDAMGQVYFDLKGSNYMYEVYDYGPVVEIAGTTTGSCVAATPCILASHAISTPGTMSMDRYNNLFFADGDAGAAMSTVQPVPANLVYLYDPFPFQTNPSSPIVVDSNDNIYSVWSNDGTCSIMQSSLYNAEYSSVNFIKVAGGHTCGFAGDGGQAGSAEIGAKIGQMAFDLGLNLYFTDTSNNRVRRIDNITGQINTIAGNGTAGYTGDNSAATSAELSTPTGIAVDSQGQVYIISSAATGQVIRKLGPNGVAAFGALTVGTTSSAHVVRITNTGNASLTMSSYAITGANASDFLIDPTTTSCILTAGANLSSGQSCTIGVLFKPTNGGARSASLVLLNNTVTNSNTIQLTGAGMLAPTVTITSPTAGSSVQAGTTIQFAVSVTATTSPAPTGSVRLLLDGSTIGAGPITLSAGKVSANVSTSVTGSHTLSANYSGDAYYSSLTGVSRTFTVTGTAIKTVTHLASSINPATQCSAVEFSASVTGADGSKPTGAVELMSGNALLARGELVDGTAKFLSSRLGAGTNVLTARYAGDLNHAASSSPEFRQMVSPTSSCRVQGINPPSLTPKTTVPTLH